MSNQLPVECPRCRGTGNNDNYDSTDDSLCPKCGGLGEIQAEQPAAPGVTHDPVVAMHEVAPLDDEPVTDDDRRAIAEGWAAYQRAPGAKVSEYEPDWNAIDHAANGDLDVQRLFRHPQTRDQASRLHDEKRTAALMKHVTESGFTIVRSNDLARTPGAEETGK